MPTPSKIIGLGKGYIRLYRKLYDDPLWQENRIFSRVEAWIDLILSANGKDNEVMLDGRPLLVKRGQRLTSQRSLAERWKWSKTKVRDYLCYLKKDGKIAFIADHKKTLVTITNYNRYNPLSEDKKTTEKPRFPTNRLPKPDHPTTDFSDQLKSEINHSNQNNYDLPGSQEKTTEEEGKKTTERPQKNHRLATNNKREIKRNIYSQKFSDFISHWNSKKSLRKIQDEETQELKDTRTELSKALTGGCSLEEIKAAVDNYDVVLGDREKYFFNYKWPPSLFLKRGLKQFLFKNEPLSNFLKGEFKSRMEEEQGKKGGDRSFSDEEYADYIRKRREEALKK